MTIWILALLLVAALAGLGYRQGAIRVSFSLIAIFLGALLAVPLSKPMAILLKAFGVTHPVVLWMVPPFMVFCLISIIFKSLALFAHHKIEVYFKYKAGDLRLSLWERLNRRIGLCLGVVNGVAYMVLISFVIHIFSYWTVQMESSDGMSRPVLMLNRLGRDLQSTGFDLTARSLDRMPANYYEAADAVGLIYQNPLLEARLSRYPAFLMLGEKQEFQALATDPEFSAMRVRHDSLSQLMAYAPVQAIVGNADMLMTIWSIAAPNLKDLNAFMETGQSQKFDDPILGRWSCDIRGTVAELRKARPNMTSRDMQAARQSLQLFYSKTLLVIGTEGQLVGKNFPDFSAPQIPGMQQPFQSGQGTWNGAKGFYEVTLTLGGAELKATASVENDRIRMTLNKMVIVFEREY